MANLLAIVIFSGHEPLPHFSRTDRRVNPPDKPSWMGKVTYADLKPELIGSIVAISAIDLLKAFVNIKSANHEELALAGRYPPLRFPACCLRHRRCRPSINAGVTVSRRIHQANTKPSRSATVDADVRRRWKNGQ